MFSIVIIDSRGVWFFQRWGGENEGEETIGNISLSIAKGWTYNYRPSAEKDSEASGSHDVSLLVFLAK